MATTQKPKSIDGHFWQGLNFWLTVLGVLIAAATFYLSFLTPRSKQIILCYEDSSPARECFLKGSDGTRVNPDEQGGASVPGHWKFFNIFDTRDNRHIEQRSPSNLKDGEKIIIQAKLR